MKDLRIKILLFTSTATLFLILHLIGYIYNINIFKEQLNVLERSHDFMEDVLELRRYEKNFVYKIDVQDLDEVLSYIRKIKVEVKNITSKDILKKCSATKYISGMGAKDYQNDSKFKKESVALIYQSFSHPQYPQKNSKSFEIGLSALDIAFNIGSQDSSNLLKGL